MKVSTRPSRPSWWRFLLFALFVGTVATYLLQKAPGTSSHPPAVAVLHVRGRARTVSPVRPPTASSSSTVAAYFAAYRYKTDRMRSRQIGMLQSLIDNPAAPQASRAQASAQLLAVTHAMGQETEIEQILKAKGFTPTAAVLAHGSATVIVPEKTLTESQVAQVADVVGRVTGFPLTSIAIIPKG